MGIQDVSKWSAVRQPRWIIVLVLWWRTFLYIYGTRETQTLPWRVTAAVTASKRYTLSKKMSELQSWRVARWSTHTQKNKGTVFTAEWRLWWWREGGWGKESQWKLTSGTQKAPSYIDGRREEAVLLGAAVVAADHDVMSEDDAACRHADVAGVIRHRTADAVNQTTWKRGGG